MDTSTAFRPNLYWVEAQCADGQVKGNYGHGFTEHEGVCDAFEHLRNEGFDPQDVESITLDGRGGWPYERGES